MARDFPTLLKYLRLRAGYGLRQFAEVIGDAPSNYCAIEAGKRTPWRSVEKLRKVADCLAIEEGTSDWDEFFLSAREEALPPDVGHLLQRPLIPVLLRTVDEMQLTEEELRDLIAYVRRKESRGAS